MYNNHRLVSLMNIHVENHHVTQKNAKATKLLSYGLNMAE